MATGSGDVSAVYEILYNPDHMPRSSPQAHVENLTVDGKPTFILMKEAAGEYYEVDPLTHAIWQKLDGSRTVKEIYEEVRSVDDKLTEKDVRDVIVSLAEEGIIESTEPEIRKGRVEVMSAFQLNIQLVKDTSKSFSPFFRVTRKLISKPGLPISIVMAVAGFILFYNSFFRIFADPSVMNVAGSALLGFFFYQLVVLLPVYAVHELAHAAMCDYYGGRPGEIGTGLYYLAPFFYCDTSDAWRLSRRARIMISVAGPLSTVVISSLLVFWSYFTSGYLKDVLQISAFFGYYGSLTNFSPVIETDGYYILADVLNIPNLRDEAFSYMKGAFLALIGRPVKAVRRAARVKRIIAVYTIFTVAWLAFFGYTTAWLMGIYSVSAYLALASLVSNILGLKAFDLTAVGANVATLAYFGLFVAGFIVMGAVAYRNIRMKGVKLETIHNKKASVFLPLPSDVQRLESSELVEKSKKMAHRFSHFSSVTLQPPFCVAELKLGRVDQSLEAMWEEMKKIEESFRVLHRTFLNQALARRSSASTGAELKGALISLAECFPASERRQAVGVVSRYVRRQEERVGYVLQAAFGTVWTLGLAPDDYKRISRGMFPSLISGDLSVTDLSSEVEEFKVSRVLGLEAMAKLFAEIDAESKEVYKKPEVYQTTAILEPLKSRLVFVGRTDQIEGSVVWLGGLYLYQAWIGYIGEVLDEAALGLSSLRLSHPTPLTQARASKLGDGELRLLKESLDRTEALANMVDDALTKIDSTTASATNFNEMLGSLVVGESFDVGLYRPIMTSNGERLQLIGKKIEKFRDEFELASKRLALARTEVREEYSTRTSAAASGKSRLDGLVGAIMATGRGGVRRSRSRVFDSQTRQIFVTTRLAYGLVVGSSLVL